MNSVHQVAEAANADTGLDGAYQLPINQFIDDFRSASPAHRSELVAQAPEARDGRLAALLAGVVHALCDETHLSYPDWLTYIGVKSPEPFFVLSRTVNRSAFFAFVQMLESPRWFFSRNVFVPENYLNRA